MSDFLVELGTNPSARLLAQKLGLPIPLPQKLKRTSGAWEERPLADREVVVSPARMAVVLSQTLPKAGANVWLSGGDFELFSEAGEPWGRPPRLSSECGEDFRAHGLVYDATDLETPSGLTKLHGFFQPRVKAVAPCARVVVIGRPLRNLAPASAAAQAALEGFVRSLAKELGKRGATAVLVRVEPGAEARLEPVLRFFMSDRATFVTGQVIEVTSEVTLPSKVPAYAALDGKVALVTGAARGIGEATAKALAREGAKLICLDRPEDDGPASAVAREVGGVPLMVDLSDPSAPATIAGFVKEKFGGIDIVVHNAGITRDRTLAKMDLETFDKTIDVNLAAVLRVQEALAPLIRDGGRIVALASIAGIAGNFGQTNYAASKSGVIGWVEAMAPSLAGKGIAINAVAPGFIETRLTAAIPAATREVARRLSALSQGGLPEDVAEVITFLSSPGGGASTGRTLRVCGGNFVGA
ncbi:MAG: 3-oxoacyl-ACP reductase [Deltaproteobacteria bacterium]|nr:3-oxoacyl-ACP reductase [Deltaproteobacteria bacterium]